MQMRRNKSVTEEAARVEYVAADPAVLDLRELFPTPAPLELDLGCGDGSFLAALAAAHPERNYLGIEQLIGRVRTACRTIAALGLTNARILRVDIAGAVTTLLPASSVEVCHLMFPDPWPKRRHHIRRTVNADFFRATSRILVPGGLLRLTTDDAPYFVRMQALATDAAHFAPVENTDATSLPRSTFEGRFAESGLPIHRLVLRKVSEPR